VAVNLPLAEWSVCGNPGSNTGDRNSLINFTLFSSVSTPTTRNRLAAMAAAIGAPNFPSPITLTALFIIPPI
jgi:hypothetical protein